MTTKAKVIGNDLTEPFDHKSKAATTKSATETDPKASATKPDAVTKPTPSTSKDEPPTKRSRPNPTRKRLHDNMDEDDEEDDLSEEEEEPVQIVAIPNPQGTHRPSFLTTYAEKDVKPHTFRNTIFIVVSPHSYLAYFQNVYRAIVNKLYPTHEVPAGTCTEDQFTRICRYLLKARIDAVFSQTAGRRIDNRTPVARDYPIAKSITDVINAIGVVYIDQGGLFVCPQPEAQAVDEDLRSGTYGTYQNLTAVSTLIKRAEGLGIIKTETISPRPEGTPFWIMSAHTLQDAVALDAGVAQATAVFREFTPSDAIFCVMVQNGFNGHVGGHNTVLWTMEPITGIQELRSTYALQA